MGSLKIFGFGISSFFLALGIACLVIGMRNNVDCGLDGEPPLRDWVFGTGIAYTVIGGSLGIGGLVLTLTVIGVIPVIVVGILALPFTFAWTIVGAVSLWRDGADCQSGNYEIWAVAMATVIISFVLIIAMCGAAKSAKNEAEN